MKNALKKAISALLVAVMVFGAAPLAGFVGFELPELNFFSTKAEAATEGYYTYSVSNGEAIITSVDTSISGNITIPSTFGGYFVTSIDSGAFYNCKNLVTVTIPDSIISIGSLAFGNCTSLESITIPDGVTSIYGLAFSDCTSLTSVTIPNNVTNIYNYTFSGCTSLASVTIPDSVISIGYYAFSSCTNLVDVYYDGSKSEWKKIVIEDGNEYLTSAKIHYSSKGTSDSGSTETPDVPDNIPDYDSSVADAYLMPTPTQTTISYGNSIVLHVDASKIPEGGYVKWTPSNDNFSYSVSADGTTCTITPKNSGNTNFTATIYDADGKPVLTDKQSMTSKAGLFDKIIAFFKKLFGLTKTIPEAFNCIY